MTGSPGPNTMNRLIHNAVRRDLGRLGAALASFPAGDAHRAEALRTTYGFLHHELTRHHEGEDTHIWPMLAGLGADPELLRAMEVEHEAMAASLTRTEEALDGLVASPDPATARAAAAQVTELTEVVDQHLRHEETDLEPVLHPHHDSPEWKAVEKKLRGGSVREAGLFFAWLTDGMEPSDREFLSSVIPAPVTFLLPRLFGRAYARDIAPAWSAV